MCRYIEHCQTDYVVILSIVKLSVVILIIVRKSCYVEYSLAEYVVLLSIVKLSVVISIIVKLTVSFY